MPHKNKEDAEKAAKEVGIDKSQVTDSEAGYFIAPQGVKSSSAKAVYANCRAKGGDKEYCARVAWSIEKRINGDTKDE